MPGAIMAPHLLNATRLRKEVLETLEDRLVDRLIWRATAGRDRLRRPRAAAEIDLNREEREIDPSLIAPPLVPGSLVQSARTRGGLGLIPSRITGSGPIWRERIPRAELERRIASIHQPYHAALAEALAAARARFGDAVLLDCHSMPPRHRPDNDGSRPATIVFGDRHGTTISGDLLDAAMTASRAMGYRTACNAPYAGGYIVARHGRPGAGVHALQLEIDRSAYLDADLQDARARASRAMARLIAGVAQAIEHRLLSGQDALAAE